MRRVAALVSGAVVILLSSRASAQSPPAAPMTIAVGDWQLAPTLQLRTRGEVRHDPLDMGGIDMRGNAGERVRDAFGVFERTRVGIGAEHASLRAQITLQDARAWGAVLPDAILGTEAGRGSASFGAYEAFAEVRTSAARPSYLRIGRQAITWGDGRLIGNADGSPVGRSLDAVRGHASFGPWDFELLASILSTPYPLGPSAASAYGATTLGTELFGAQAALALDPLAKIELSALARITDGGAIPELTRFALARAQGETYAGSLRVFGESRGWRYAAEGAYELGRAPLLGDADIAAYAAAAYVEKKLDLLLSPSIRLGGEYASGDDGKSGTYRQFDPLLPDVHPLHGAMDVLAWSNTLQAHARIAFVPWTDARATIDYRYARMADASGEWLGAYLQGIGRGSGRETELGHEIDAHLGWRPWPMLDLAAGYSIFAIGDGARLMLAAQGRGAVKPESVTPSAFSHFATLQATLEVP